MRNVEIKLPPGLAPTIEPVNINMQSPWPGSNKNSNDDLPMKTHTSTDEELLLSKKNDSHEFHGDIMNGDSSGCSSGKGSVISSEESENNMSYTVDSGTEQPKTPSNDSICRENSLRLRKTGSDNTNNHWDNWPGKKSVYVTMPTTEKASTWNQKKPENYCKLGITTESETNPSYVAIGRNPTSNYLPNNVHSLLLDGTEVRSQDSVLSGLPPAPLLSHNAKTGYSSIIPSNFATTESNDASMPYIQVPVVDRNSELSFKSKLEDDFHKTEPPIETTEKLNEPTIASGAKSNALNSYCRLGLDSDSNKRQVDIVADRVVDKASSANTAAITVATPKTKTYVPVDKVMNYVPHRQFENKMNKED